MYGREYQEWVDRATYRSVIENCRFVSSGFPYIVNTLDLTAEDRERMVAKRRDS